MLELLEPYVVNASPRIIPAWTQYVSAIETQSRILMKRFILGADVQTSGIALLRYILACVDWNYMLRDTSDFDKYMFHVRFVRKDLQNTFDHVNAGYMFYNLFTKKNIVKVPEFIIPAEDVIPTTYLPFDKPWPYWIHVKPVRYIVHDSSELALNIEQDKVKFYKSPPSHVVISIDVVALVFKYMKYLTTDIEEYDVTSGERVGKDQRRFLHKFVLFGFIEDQIDTFLIRQLVDVWNIQDKDQLEQFTTNNKSTDLQFGFVGLRYNESCRVIYREFEKIRNGTTRPSMITSAGLLTARRSIYDRMRLFLDKIEVPLLRQYQFYRILRDRDLFLFILSMYEGKTMVNYYKQMCRTVKPKIQRLLRQKVWTYTKDVLCRSLVQDTLEFINDHISYR